MTFSSTIYAEWTKVSEGGERGVNNGSEYYVDFEAIRKVEGYIYLQCIDWSKEFEYTDHLRLELNTNELDDFLLNTDYIE